jgi:tRNA(Ile)-lysidine synthase
MTTANSTTLVQRRFVEFVRTHNLIQSGDRILVALSGGVDSVVLTDLLLTLRSELAIQASAAHLNHRIRGDEADRDEAFVKNLCRERQIVCHVSRQDVQQYSRQHKKSLETAARECRYQFLKSVAKENHFNKIATGHSASDQVETIIDHWLRGSGVRGLSGMPPVQGDIIRPLLFATRKEINIYAEENGLQFCQDSSNADCDFKRNRIRHMLLPMLQQHFNPNMPATLLRMGSIMREIDDYLAGEAEAALQNCVKRKTPSKIILDIHQYLAYFNIIKKYMLLCAFSELAGGTRYITFDMFDRIETLVYNRSTGSHLHISEDAELYINRDELVIQHRSDTAKNLTIPHLSGHFRLWEGFTLEIKHAETTLAEIEKNTNPNIAWVDTDKIQLPLTVRTFKHGDMFFPLNLDGSKKVSDFFINSKVPVYQRTDIPILESLGQIVWICGYRQDDRFKITHSTKNVCQFILSTSQ